MQTKKVWQSCNWVFHRSYTTVDFTRINLYFFLISKIRIGTSSELIALFDYEATNAISNQTSH